MLRCLSNNEVRICRYYIEKPIVLLFLILAVAHESFGQQLPDSLIQNALNVSYKHLEASVLEVKDSTRYPSYAPHNLQWSYFNSSGWTSGFYPGCLWLAYELSGRNEFKEWAKKWTAGLEKEASNTGTHDLGFMFDCSFGNGLKSVSRNEAAAYKEILLKAAMTLDKRYSPKVGMLRCYWDEPPFSEDTTLYPVVVDIMMNLELLFWAAENGAPQSLKEHAIQHALHTYRDFVRPDGGTYHVVRYNKDSGKIFNKGQLQGQSENSTWTRGHAWFIYGMTLCYRYTRDERFLEKACALADYFLKRLSPDNVSIWDFDSFPQFKEIKDASATAITSSALFELSTYVKDSVRQEKYRLKATAMLAALCSNKYLAENEKTNAILLHSTQYLTQPGNQNTDKPAIFADYYFLEAIKRYLTLEKKGKLF
ncbi:MAG: glycoside hydrolase family 88 protein [Bacteroidota bacterium]